MTIIDAITRLASHVRAALRRMAEWTVTIDVPRSKKR